MTYFWYLALVSLLAACFLAIPLILGGPVSVHWPLIFGVTVILGAAVSFVNGMLYKIVPFLIWLHLQRKLIQAPVLMQTLIKERGMWFHFGAHVAALLVTVAAVFWPPLWTRLAGFLWVCAGSSFGVNLASAAFCYRRAMRPVSCP